MYFETPDGSAKGWKSVGNVNPLRLKDFHQYLATRPANSLETLLRDDKRFTGTKGALDAYAEAWALTYFLMQKHQKEYISYLRMLSAKKPLLQDGPDRRIDEFRKAFGELDRVNADFLRYVTTRLR
jgi:hypothetical protein